MADEARPDTAASNVLPPVTSQQFVNQESWGSWFRNHFAVFVLLFMVVFLFFYNLHIVHDPSDAKLTEWAEGHSQTFVGALVGALTTQGVNQLVKKDKQ